MNVVQYAQDTRVDIFPLVRTWFSSSTASSLLPSNPDSKDSMQARASAPMRIDAVNDQDRNRSVELPFSFSFFCFLFVELLSVILQHLIAEGQVSRIQYSDGPKGVSGRASLCGW